MSTSRAARPPADSPRTEGPSACAHVYTLELPAPIAERLERCARRRGFEPGPYLQALVIQLFRAHDPEPPVSEPPHTSSRRLPHDE